MFMQENDPYKRLREAIVERIGSTLESPADFERLALLIKSQSGDTISASTLKRLFGYVRSESGISNSSLSLIVRWLGYKGWSDFLTAPEVQSQFLTGTVLKSDSLEEDDRVLFRWNPDRCCTARYIGHNRFVVEQVEHAKLKIGDTFQALQFALHSPVYFTDVCPAGTPQGEGRSYVAGYRTGLTELAVIKKPE